MLFVHIVTPEKFDNALKTPVVLDLCLMKARTEKSHYIYYHDDLVFEKLCFQMLSVNNKTLGRHFQIPLV